MKNVWLLDIDGVLNIISKKPPKYGWDYDRWLRLEVLGFQITTAEELVDFISNVHESGLAEVIWCTTWQKQANDLGKKLGLPYLRWIDCDKFALAGRQLWWKGKAAQLLVNSGEYRVVHTDDDIKHHWISRRYETFNHPNLLKISPNEYEGLMPKETDKILEFFKNA